MSAKKDQSRRNVASMARSNAAEAMDTIVKAMRDPDMRIALDAAKHMLDRAIGKPIQMSADVTDRLDELTDDELDAALAVINRQIEIATEQDAAEKTAPAITH